MTQGAGQGPDVRDGGFMTRDGGLPRPAHPAVATASGPAAHSPVTSGVPANSPAPARSSAPVHAPTHPVAAAAPAGPAGPTTGPASGSAPAPVEWPVPPAAPHPVAQQSPPPAPQAQPPSRQGLSEEYTPTQRDIPVVEDPAGEPTLVDVTAVTAVAASGEEGDGPLYVVGDVHGFLDELRAALRAEGIIDEEDHWIAGNSRIWFLGDFTDRGPDGVGVIDLVMQLSAEAAAAGGYCKALMGNHELLFLGAKRFGDTPVNSGAGTASFQAAWLLNGGQRSDMERLEDHHVQWMARLDAMALADEHLLVHSDATCYLDYGSTIEGVNDAVTEALQRNDADETWEMFRKFTKRFAFRDENTGTTAVRELLGTFGGTRVVHGHSPIPYLLGEVGSEDEDGEEKPPDVTGPHLYADGLALAMDGGVTMAGKLLVTRLPITE
ncbi:metallophosphoesterase [Streptomyces sp. HNM0574]|uniref:metallophosphoesterase n=1 Tax=Streptomyces sp. HNM0574 TaxID=2714954 RepID=UPI001F1008E5|nr:metallophosphoesterase [Streptomyces sp. HNM0574]